MAATQTSPSLWDPRFTKEAESDMVQRHRKAMVACMKCPVLDACEAMLSDHERGGVTIAGIVAGRYSDVAPWVNVGGSDRVQATCRRCGEPMRPQCGKATDGESLPKRRHLGEGLCDWCYPLISRAARKRAAA